MISRKAEYAIATLAELAQSSSAGAAAARTTVLRGASATSPGVLTSRALAVSRGIPPTLIAQIVAALAKAGWVVTRRGAGGGISLAVNPASITLREVIELIDGPVGITRCLVDDAACAGRDLCALRGIWAEAQARMLEVLDGVTVAALARAIEPGAAPPGSS